MKPALLDMLRRRAEEAETASLLDEEEEYDTRLAGEEGRSPRKQPASLSRALSDWWYSRTRTAEQRASSESSFLKTVIVVLVLLLIGRRAGLDIRGSLSRGWSTLEPPTVTCEPVQVMAGTKVSCSVFHGSPTMVWEKVGEGIEDLKVSTQPAATPARSALEPAAADAVYAVSPPPPPMAAYSATFRPTRAGIRAGIAVTKGVFWARKALVTVVPSTAVASRTSIVCAPRR